MLSRLKQNTAHRLAGNKDYNTFLKNSKTVRSFKPTSQENWGVEDLQLAEGICILKDMICIHSEKDK
jgi:hypothetical protein